jgi:neutral amino acid transport system substrate-binding protein
MVRRVTHAGRWIGSFIIAGNVALAALTIGCSDTAANPSGETIRLGASLPFSGKESAMGRNLEQALLLAIDDVNDSGGINGVPLELVARDSNSGSARGLNDLLDLLYNENVAFLIGPEESNLANAIVEDVRSLDVLNILPGDAAPSSSRSSTTGAWLRLAPTPFAVACGLGAHAIAEGARTANTLYSLEDYNTSLATDFRFQFRNQGGQMLASVSIQPGQTSYASAIDRVMATHADQTLLIAYPATAASIVTDWVISGRVGSWYLSPLLRTEVFLLNIPYGALDGSFGVSPTLSLTSECDMLEGHVYGSISCGHANADRFVKHFNNRWDGDRPFSAAHYYYDAVVLLAMGMQYAQATRGSIPSSAQMHQLIRKLNRTSNERGYWFDLSSAMRQLAAGQTVRYVGAAAEYEFDDFGVAQHRAFDTWTIRQNSIVAQGVDYASCMDVGDM